MRVANNPDARLTEQIMAALYLNHPYGRPVIGWRRKSKKLDREDALAFYRRFYAPNNAILVIAGDVDAKEIRPMVEKFICRYPAQPAIPAERLRPQEPVPAGPAHRDAGRPARQADQRAALFTWCPLPRPQHRREPALDVLAQDFRGSNSYLIARW